MERTVSPNPFLDWDGGVFHRFDEEYFCLGGLPRDCFGGHLFHLLLPKSTGGKPIRTNKRLITVQRFFSELNLTRVYTLGVQSQKDMYTPIDFEEDYVLGMRLHGNVGREDFIQAMQKVIPEMESEGHFNLYMEIEPDQLDAEMVWESLKFGFSESKEHMKRLDKLAVVTDKSWLKTISSLESKLISTVDEKTYSFEDKDEAVQWVSSKNGK